MSTAVGPEPAETPEERRFLRSAREREMVMGMAGARVGGTEARVWSKRGSEIRDRDMAATVGIPGTEGRSVARMGAEEIDPKA